MPFDVQGALTAGYTVDDIGKHVGFDVAGAKQGGYSDQEIINYLSGTSSPKVAQKQAKTEEAGFFGNVIESAGNRLSNISNPKPSDMSRFSPTLGSALNVAGQAGGFVADVAGAGINAIPGATEAITGIVQSQKGNPIVDLVKSGWNQFSEGTQNDLENLANATMILPGASMARGTLSAGKEGINIVRDIGTIVKTPANIEKKLSTVVGKGIDKAIRPTVVGKRTAPQAKKYYEKAKMAVKNIIDNKNNLVLTDIDGNAVTGLPKTLKQFSEAIDQTKKSIYQQYHSMATEAGEAGSLFNADNILTKLDDVANDLKHNPQVRKYANDLKAEIEELHGQPPDIIEARIADLNNSLSGFYEGRVSKAKAQVDSSVANLMRNELDNNIMSAVGSGYQNLKNQYGALKTLEKEVNHRAIVNARKNTKGLLDFSDVFTGGEIIGGVLSANPAWVVRGVAGKGIMQYVKFLNNPDRIVKGMFSDAEKLINKSSIQPEIRSATGNAFMGKLSGMENVISREPPGAVPIPRRQITGTGMEVGPVRSGVLQGSPYGPPAGRLIYPKELPAGQGFELRGQPTDPDIIDTAFTSRSRPILGLPAAQDAERLSLPAGQGFELRPRSEEVANILAQMKSDIQGAPKSLPAGQGFELVDQPTVIKPDAAKTAKPEEFIGGYLRAARERQAQQALMPPNSKKAPEGIIARIMQDGGIKDNVDYNSRLMRQSPDGKRVMRKHGVYTADEWSQILTSEGYVGIETGDKLIQAIESGKARNILTPGKQEIIMNRQARRLEDEWIARELEKLGNAQNVRAEISADQEYLKRSIFDETQAEGLIDSTQESAALKEINDFFSSVTKPTTKGKFTGNTREGIFAPRGVLIKGK